ITSLDRSSLRCREWASNLAFASAFLASLASSTALSRAMKASPISAPVLYNSCFLTLSLAWTNLSTWQPQPPSVDPEPRLRDTGPSPLPWPTLQPAPPSFLQAPIKVEVRPQRNKGDLALLCRRSTGIQQPDQLPNMREIERLNGG
ncbi:hypothetical protein PanWU01x14_080010, partial [Parasponia andersonii]